MEDIITGVLFWFNCLFLLIVFLVFIALLEFRVLLLFLFQIVLLFF